MTEAESVAVPAVGTLERWAFDYIISTTLEAKLSPPPLPETAWEESPPSRRALRPGRPPALQPATKKSKTPKGEQLRDPKKRAQLLHGFLHHELQAAELFAWAMLTFVDAPKALRLGWLKIALDECRHMRMYEGELQRLGFTYGDFGVRDWFWERLPACQTAASFLAVMGVGLEGGNLDHGERFTQMLEAVGDQQAAEVQKRIAHEELAHVRFALRWLEKLEVPIEPFEAFVNLIPYPLSPIVLRGPTIAREARVLAGQSERFIDALIRFEDRGSTKALGSLPAKATSP